MTILAILIDFTGGEFCQGKRIDDDDVSFNENPLSVNACEMKGIPIRI